MKYSQHTKPDMQSHYGTSMPKKGIKLAEDIREKVGTLVARANNQLITLRRICLSRLIVKINSFTITPDNESRVT